MVEVLSRGTERTDRVTKLDDYAEAGIRYYWLVDPTAPVTISSFVLVEGRYELTGEHVGTRIHRKTRTPLMRDPPWWGRRCTP